MRVSRYLPALLAVFALAAVGECVEAPKDVRRSKTLERAKEFYGFATWPGRGGPIRSGLKLDPGMLPEGLVIEEVRGPSLSTDPLIGRFHVSRDYIITRAEGQGELEVTITVAEDCAQVHEILISQILNFPCPPGMARGAEFGLDLGDVCFGNPADVQWVRSNVFVRVLANSRPEMTPFFGPIARALDEELCRRPTSSTYAECPARPVITEVARVIDSEEMQRLGVEWKAVEVKDPNGEEVTLVSIAPREGWGGINFQVAINESNLLGFPLPGIAEWKPDHPRSAEFDATIDTFLSRFATPAQRALATGAAARHDAMG
jgi:hypothetical protein